MRPDPRPAPVPRQPQQRSISLHVGRLVVDEALLTAGGEQALRHALVEALEQMLPEVIAGASLKPGPSGTVAAPAEAGRAGALRAAPVTAGSASLLAAGVAERVASQVGSMVATVRPGGGAR